MYSADCAVGKAKCEYVTLKTFQVRNKMFPSFYNVRRFVAGIAFTWALLLVLMHERLLKQHHETEKSAAQILTGNMLLIRCGDEVSVLRDRICIKRFKWVIVNWIKNKCFGEYGVSSEKDIDCSVYQYLVFVERVCPIPENVVEFFSSVITPRKDLVKALPKTNHSVSFESLMSQLRRCGKACRWILTRANLTSKNWLQVSKKLENTKNAISDSSEADTNKAFSPNKSVISTKRIRQRILLHMGLLTTEYGLNFGEAAFVGGPLGELVQWTDLMLSLSTLGHEIVLSWSPESLREVVQPNGNQLQGCQPARTVDLIFTDLTGLEQLREVLGSLYHYRCLVRILDVYGTDPEFNHPYFNPDKDKTRSWGGKGLDPAQFFTHFPHSPDNSFLGFVVEKYQGDIAKLKSGNIALLYGKRTSIASGSGKHKYLGKITEYYQDIHATMWTKDGGDDDNLPSYVNNHKNLEQDKFLELLRKSSLYVGLGRPLEGPAALEALANGVVFLNPKFTPPQQVDGEKPTNRKLTSQNPYAERIGEPYVYTVNTRDLSAVEEALKKIDKTKKPKPYVPYEFTYEGFLERIDVYLENQDFCSDVIRTKVGTPIIWAHNKRRWPPPTVLKIQMSDYDESCTSACSRHKMVCERSLFPDINSLKSFRTMALPCTNNLKVFPKVEHEKFQKIKKKNQQFRTPCHSPSFNVITEECLTQTDELLFSCACTPPNGIKRLCPCRQYQYEQIALFPFLS